MRHFGVPTRLLDWSEAFDVAVYFAIQPLARLYIEQQCQDVEEFIHAVGQRIGAVSSDPGAVALSLEQIYDRSEEPQPLGDVGRRPVLWILNPAEATARSLAWQLLGMSRYSSRGGAYADYLADSFRPSGSSAPNQSN
jgi:hypothetical protein